MTLYGVLKHTLVVYTFQKISYIFDFWYEYVEYVELGISCTHFFQDVQTLCMQINERLDSIAEFGRDLLQIGITKNHKEVR